MNATHESVRTIQNRLDRTGTGQTKIKGKRRLPETHQDFWLSRVKKRTYCDRDGKEREIPTYAVRLFHLSKEDWFNLHTANKDVAAGKARDVYVYLKANGWDATRAKFKPESQVTPKNKLTLSEFFEAVSNMAQLRPRTFRNYQNCFRTIVSEAFGVKGGKEKYDYRKGGNQKWQSRVDAIRLERITPPCVTNWQKRRVKDAGNSPTAIASAKRTANTYVRCARSLFSSQIIGQLKKIELPKPLPFDGVELFESGSTKYVSKVNVQALIAAAKEELKLNEPEAYKTFLLGLFSGLRRAEIDLLEWRMVDWQNRVIRLEETEWLHLKTKDSTGEVTVDPEVLEELRLFKQQSNSPFVVSSTVVWGKGKKRSRTRPPRNDSVWPYYRCKPVFDRLSEWLRGKGVTANKPLHELRKEIGALIATEHGIYAASRFLRHSDITTTARHYADHKTRISVGLGKYLDTDIKAEANSNKAQ